MRIDPNIPAQVAHHGKAVAQMPRPAGNAVDRDSGGATLKLNAAAVTNLTSSSAVPDIRQERVQALKAAVDNNTYKPQPDKIADSMLAGLTNLR
jgi:flagellar biosynthesis anti-sigma factor FlgM